MLRSAPALLLAALVLAACDSGPAIDPPTPGDIAGTYNVQEFSFEPDASALETAVLLDTLVAADTRFEVLDSGQALLRYRFQGGSQRVLQGQVEVRSEQVRLSFDDGTSAARTSLLLPERLVFDRVGGALAVSTPTRVNLAAFAPNRYGGFTDVPGTLVLRLVQQSDG